MNTTRADGILAGATPASFAMLALATAMVLSLGACAFSVGKTTPIGSPVSVSMGAPPAMSKGDVEKAIADKLSAQVGQRPKKVECPEDLPTRQGASLRCILSANDDSTVGITVTVTQVGKPNDASAVDYSIEADSQMTPAPHG